MLDSATELGIALIVVAGIMVLARPGSQGPSIISNLLGGFAQLIGAATGSSSTTASSSSVTNNTRSKK